MRKRLASGLAVIAGFMLGAAALAAPVTDCPGRDVLFSAQSPVIDLMLSPAASAVMAKQMPARTAATMQPATAATSTPSFMAIMTLREAARFSGMNAEQIAQADAELRKLPVTAADKVARCARYDNEVPSFDLPARTNRGGKVRLLLFEKINGFRDGPSVDAAHAAMLAMAERKGWAIVTTDKAGVFNPRSLARFDAVIWNNISGDVLTLAQRRAFRNYLNRGGAFVGMHGSAGDPVYFWDWYPDGLLGARFKAHPMNPQFQEARIAVNSAHPLAAGLPAEWRMTDEWYSFRTNPRAVGANVLLTLDETTYSPVGPTGMDLRMGADHPLAWTNCIGRGRMFYSAIGHKPETYSQPQHVAMLEAAVGWAATARKACPARAGR